MESFIQFIIEHALIAHWFIFGAILLAGMNIPISADLLMIISAMLAATIVPEHTIQLFLSVFLGCYFSAWIAYWLGRVAGPALSSKRLFSKILHPDQLEKVKLFYKKYGLFTLLIGRFIPFGVRNCIFMSTGISKMPFGAFILKDLIACFVWSTTCFSTFFILGQNYQHLYNYVKAFNLLIFLCFSVTLIGIIWYKRRKKARSQAS